MGKVGAQVKARVEKLDKLQAEYIDTLKWCIDQLDNCIYEMVEQRTNILNATKEHVEEIKAEMRTL